MNISISTERPPCWDKAVKAFDFDQSRTIFAYGKVIYNPGRVQIPEYLLVHEETHMMQQEFDDTVAKLWWDAYIQDPVFRIHEEVEAYGRQYAFMCKGQPDRNKREKILFDIAKDLSGPTYGNAVSHSMAVRMVRTYAEGL